MKIGHSIELDDMEIDALWCTARSAEQHVHHNANLIEDIKDTFAKDLDHLANKAFAEGLKLASKLNQP